ncbi:MAG: hypothetical protein PHD51_02275 [Patescibacteria group bacterium]|nr:hypothetical protein [Patescibacteria group bacterium]MDD5490312.1 hypothetical protein [Patescibacteria group bacterium]
MGKCWRKDHFRSRREEKRNTERSESLDALDKCEVCGQDYGKKHSGPGKGSKHEVTFTACCWSPYKSHPKGQPCCEYVEDALDQGLSLKKAIEKARALRKRDDAR